MKELSIEHKRILLSKVLDEVSLKKLNDTRVEEEFAVNLANILIATGGQF